MAVDGILIRLPGAVSAGNFVGLQFTVVSMHTSIEFGVIPSDGTLAPIGVYYDNRGEFEESAQVVIQGLVKVKAGVAIPVGSPVFSDAAGLLGLADLGGGQLGIAMTSAAAADEVVSVLMM